MLEEKNKNFKKVDVDIWVNEKETFTNLYQKWYTQKLHNDFIENREDKKHNINSHTKWFNTKIKLNHKYECLDVVNKWKLCMVDYGINIWTEINWPRPSLIFKANSYLQWEDVFVIPITSFKDWKIKSVDEFDIKLTPNDSNNLTNKSLLKIRQLRCISKKRIKTKRKSNKLNIFWEIIEITTRKKIENNIKRIFWI